MRRMKEVPSSERQLSAIHRPILRVSGWVWLSAMILASGLVCARADQVEMDNGDRYLGKVLSMDADTLTLQNEFLGKLQLPRRRITVIAFGTNQVSRPVAVQAVPVQAVPVHAVRPVASTNDPGNWSALMQQLGNSSSAVKEVQQQYLTGATPEAEAKFNSMLSDLSSGKMSMTDLQHQAKIAADQLRAYRKEIPDQTGMMDEYLSILDSFVIEVDALQPKTNAVRAGVARQPGR